MIISILSREINYISFVLIEYWGIEKKNMRKKYIIQFCSEGWTTLCTKTHCKKKNGFFYLSSFSRPSGRLFLRAISSLLPVLCVLSEEILRPWENKIKKLEGLTQHYSSRLAFVDPYIYHLHVWVIGCHSQYKIRLH